MLSMGAHILGMFAISTAPEFSSNSMHLMGNPMFRCISFTNLIRGMVLRNAVLSARYSASVVDMAISVYGWDAQMMGHPAYITK
jgi:ABC-type enterochelin transport system permease subunit